MRKPLTDEQKEAKKLYDKQFYLSNKTILKSNRETYLADNIDHTTKTKKDWYETNKEHAKKIVKNYKKNHRDSIKKYNNLYTKNRMIIDPLFKLSKKFRESLNKLFKLKGIKKNNKTVQILGCSFIEFKLHLESKFESWMNWDNKGRYNGTVNFGWDIDHIIPMSTAKNESDIIRLNHYTNLQPLCGYFNRVIKRDNI